jgi:hypothetical protein
MMEVLSTFIERSGFLSTINVLYSAKEGWSVLSPEQLADDEFYQSNRWKILPNWGIQYNEDDHMDVRQSAMFGDGKFEIDEALSDSWAEYVYGIDGYHRTLTCYDMEGNVIECRHFGDDECAYRIPDENEAEPAVDILIKRYGALLGSLDIQYWVDRYGYEKNPDLKNNMQMDIVDPIQAKKFGELGEHELILCCICLELCGVPEDISFADYVNNHQ